MKLSEYMVDLGRVVAYHPNLKKVTGSTTATILLCQLLYWCDKSRDEGWIWKQSYDIEEETGLTYNEQRTARAVLRDLEIIKEEYRRLDHFIRFKVDQERLNTLWEQVTGKKSEKIVKKTEQEVVKKEKLKTSDINIDITSPISDDAPLVRSSAVLKKGDMMDGILASAQSPGYKKMQAKQEIKDKILKELKINTNGKRWEEFIEFAYQRESKHGETLDTFLEWAQLNGFDPIYWTPEKMQTVYPQAYFKKKIETAPVDFVEKLPDKKKEEYAQMPSEIGRKKEIF